MISILLATALSAHVLLQATPTILCRKLPLSLIATYG